MNETIKTILSRRSTRDFSDKPISAADLDLLIQAALHAPTAMNRQTFQFTVLTQKKDIEELAEVMGKALGREGYDMYKPTALIITSNDRTSLYGRGDNACALQNIFLAAHSLGIGSVWINQLRDICDEPDVRRLLDRYEIPESHVVYGMAALGYSQSGEYKEIERVGKVKII